MLINMPSSFRAPRYPCQLCLRFQLQRKLHRWPFRQKFFVSELWWGDVRVQSTRFTSQVHMLLKQEAYNICICNIYIYIINIIPKHPKHANPPYVHGIHDTDQSINAAHSPCAWILLYQSIVHRCCCRCNEPWNNWLQIRFSWRTLSAWEIWCCVLLRRLRRLHWKKRLHQYRWWREVANCQVYPLRSLLCLMVVHLWLRMCPLNRFGSPSGENTETYKMFWSKFKRPSGSIVEKRRREERQLPAVVNVNLCHTWLPRSQCTCIELRKPPKRFTKKYLHLHLWMWNPLPVKCLWKISLGILPCTRLALTWHSSQVRQPQDHQSLILLATRTTRCLWTWRIPWRIRLNRIHLMRSWKSTKRRRKSSPWNLTPQWGGNANPPSTPLPAAKQQQFVPTHDDLKAAIMRKTTLDLMGPQSPAPTTPAPSPIAEVSAAMGVVPGEMQGFTSVVMTLAGVPQDVWVPLSRADALAAGLVPSDTWEPPEDMTKAVVKASETPKSPTAPAPGTSTGTSTGTRNQQWHRPQASANADVDGAANEDNAEGKALKAAYMRFHRSVHSSSAALNDLFLGRYLHVKRPGLHPCHK